MKLTRRALCALGLALPSRIFAQPTPSSIATVVIAPLGTFSADLVSAVEAVLRAELGVGVLTLAPLALPPTAFEAQRRRYRAERLLEFLRPQMLPPSTRILGVTEVDIFTAPRGAANSGVIGFGDIAGIACVVSAFRCRMRSPGAAQTRSRLEAACIHEVGHTLGLEHCRTATCIMANHRDSALAIDHTTGHMCNGCRTRLGLPTR